MEEVKLLGQEAPLELNGHEVEISLSGTPVTNAIRLGTNPKGEVVITETKGISPMQRTIKDGWIKIGVGEKGIAYQTFTGPERFDALALDTPDQGRVRGTRLLQITRNAQGFPAIQAYTIKYKTDGTAQLLSKTGEGSLELEIREKPLVAITQPTPELQRQKPANWNQAVVEGMAQVTAQTRANAVERHIQQYEALQRVWDHFEGNDIVAQIKWAEIPDAQTLYHPRLTWNEVTALRNLGESGKGASVKLTWQRYTGNQEPKTYSEPRAPYRGDKEVGTVTINGEPAFEIGINGMGTPPGEYQSSYSLKIRALPQTTTKLEQYQAYLDQQAQEAQAEKAKAKKPQIKKLWNEIATQVDPEETRIGMEFADDGSVQLENLTRTQALKLLGLVSKKPDGPAAMQVRVDKTVYGGFAFRSRPLTDPTNQTDANEKTRAGIPRMGTSTIDWDKRTDQSGQTLSYNAPRLLNEDADRFPADASIGEVNLNGKHFGTIELSKNGSTYRVKFTPDAVIEDTQQLEYLEAMRKSLLPKKRKGF